MSYQRDREAFIARVLREGGTLDDARAFLRDANTVQRMAAEECSYEWADTDEHRARLARAEARVEKRAQRLGWVPPALGGDPRGACVKLRVPSGATDDWGQTGICVPTREY